MLPHSSSHEVGWEYITYVRGDNVDAVRSVDQARFWIADDLYSSVDRVPKVGKSDRIQIRETGGKSDRIQIRETVGKSNRIPIR